MKKIILVFIILFLLSGCATVEYKLDIQKDLSVLENVFISATSEYFSDFYREYPKTVVKRIYDNKDFMKVFPNNGYTYQMETEKYKYPGILVNKKYHSLAEYSNNTIFKEQSFENIYTITNDNLLTIKAIGFHPYEEDVTDAKYTISNLKIKIKLPYVVVDSNADSYDKKTNTYTWEITEETKEKEINLTFDKNKIYVYNFVMYISMFILSLIVIIFAFTGYKLYRKNKINNRIVG